MTFALYLQRDPRCAQFRGNRAPVGKRIHAGKPGGAAADASKWD